jgi:hypothetical protein
LHADGAVASRDLGFDEEGSLAELPDREAALLQCATVAPPCGIESLVRVVEGIEVQRHPGRCDQLVQGCGPHQVALARGYAALG